MAEIRVELPPLEEWQKDTLNAFIEHPKDNIITVSSPRQCGKSICMEIILIYASCLKSGVSMFVSPTIAQARKVYQDVVKILKDTPLLKKKNDSTMIITFFNDSRIYFKSSEMKDALRGYTIHNVLIVDESAFVPDSVIYELLLPMTNVHHPTLILASTPKFKVGAFYQNYIRGCSEEVGNITIDWTNYDLSRYLPTEKLEIYEKQLPKLVYTSEYLGKFIDGDSTLFTNVKECIGNVSTKYSDCLLSIDWGAGFGKDYTAISVLTIDRKNSKTYLNKQYAFNKKNTQQTIDEILNIIKEWKPKKVVVESNSIGKIYYDLLREKVYEYSEELVQSNPFSDEDLSIVVKAVATSNSSKDKWVKLLAKKFEGNEIVIPDDRELINELSTYEVKISQASGLPTYNAAPGFHDDRVISLMIGVNEINSVQYAV